MGDAAANAVRVAENLTR